MGGVPKKGGACESLRLGPCVLVQPDGWALGEREGYGGPCDVTSLSLSPRNACGPTRPPAAPRRALPAMAEIPRDAARARPVEPANITHKGGRS